MKRIILAAAFSAVSGLALAESGFDLRPAAPNSDCQVVYPANSTTPVLRWDRKAGENTVIAISPSKKCPRTIAVKGRDLRAMVFPAGYADGYVFYASNEKVKLSFFKMNGSQYRFQWKELQPK